MKRSLRLIPGLLLAGCLAFLLSACGDSSPGGGTASVRGVVYAPNGVDPIPGAQVRIIPVSGPGADDTIGLVSNSPVGAKTTSGADGSFAISGLRAGEYTLVVSNGLFLKSGPLSVAGGTVTQVDGSRTTLPAVGNGSVDIAPRIAVVTGNWDEMSNVLAKFGMGQVDATGALVFGTEQFDLYLGNDVRPVWDNVQEFWDTAYYPAGYPDETALFANLAAMRRYDVIVINCGADDSAFREPGEPGVQWNLREFVRLGGRLFVTDRGNDFVEQTFPEFIRFMGAGDDPPSVPEPYSAAWVGIGGVSDAAVRDAGLAAWLGGLGALNDNGSLHIEDFLGGWAVMDGIHDTAEGGQVKVWVEGPVAFETPDPLGEYGYSESTAVRPLTVSFPFGSGKVIYTSYHTAGYPHPGFTPQERVLEYLLFF